jgi:hypothetical protein
MDSLSKRLGQIKHILYGDNDKEVDQHKCEVKAGYPYLGA